MKDYYKAQRVKTKNKNSPSKGPLMQCAPDTKFLDYWKPFKIVFLQSHPGHIVNCFTVNTFGIRHFTVFLLYFEFCLVESVENFFLSLTLGSLRFL